MAKTSVPFEIRVALIGYVSVGKSTVLNALLGAKYGEVSMRRTTAVVNNFRISDPSHVVAVEDVEVNSSSSENSPDWSMIVDDPHTSATTLAETTKDNAEFRTSDQVKEKTYDVVLDEPLCKMRKDTKLVLVDIPGINEAGSSRRYREYVEKAWHTFDVAVVVMDGGQGVNTEEQVDLLELVKGLRAETKNVPIIVLCNKVDDPDDSEQQVLVGEARRAVERIFGVSDRAKALEDLKKAGTKSSAVRVSGFLSMMPAFIPVSAMHAFIYRCGSRLTFEAFQAMDDDFIEKLGKESYGRQWRRFSKKHKLEKAFESVSDAEQCMDGMEASNFDTFLQVLSFCIGGEKDQLALIEVQFKISLYRLAINPHDCDVVADLTGVYHRLRDIKVSTSHLPDRFWSAFEGIRTKAFEDFVDSKKPDVLAKPMHLLSEYADLLKVTGWTGQTEKVVLHAKDLVLRQAGDVMDPKKFGDISAQDQFLIFGSMLLFTSDRSFSETFGKLKLALDVQYMKAHEAQGCFLERCGKCRRPTAKRYNADYCSSCGLSWIESNVLSCPNCCNCSVRVTGSGNDKRLRCRHACGQEFHVRASVDDGRYEVKYQNGDLVPVNETEYNEYVTVVVPDSPRDPKHFGHLIWSCCRLLEKIG